MQDRVAWGMSKIEIDCDYQLRYGHTIDAVTAVSGYVDADGNVDQVDRKD